MPPGVSRWPARACRMSAPRMDCAPLLEYSSPEYIKMEKPCDRPMARASSTTVAAGTPVMAAACSGVNWAA